MSRWFRFHDEALDDPKVQRLSGDLFKFWVNLLCLASRNEGLLPPTGDIAFALRVDAELASKNVKALIAAGLIDLIDDDIPVPHNWEGRQFQSDVSTERVKRFRERKAKREGNVSCAVSETPPEAESETDSKRSRARKTSRSVEKMNNGISGGGGALAASAVIYSETELQEFRFTFDLVDVDQSIAELSAWCDREGLTDPIRRKNAIYGGLKKRQGLRETARSVGQTGPPAAPSQALLGSKLVRPPRRIQH